MAAAHVLHFAGCVNVALCFWCGDLSIVDAVRGAPFSEGGDRVAAHSDFPFEPVQISSN